MSRNLLAIVHHGGAAGGFFMAATIAILLAAAVAPASAQSSLDLSSAPTTDYAMPPPDGGSLAEPSTSDDAITDDASADDATPIAADDATPIASGNATSKTPAANQPRQPVKPVAAADNDSPDVASRSGWDRVGDVDADSENADPARVLEVPQAIQPEASQPAESPDQTAQDAGLPSPDQVGSIDDYQDEEDGVVFGGIIVPIGPLGLNPYGTRALRTNPAPVSPGIGHGFGRAALPGSAPILPLGTSAGRPFAGGMNSAILPTSPMFPRTTMFSRSSMFPRAPLPRSGGMWGRSR